MMEDMWPVQTWLPAPDHPSRLLVKAPLAALRAAAPAARARVLRYMPEIGWAVVDTRGARDEVAHRLARHPGVRMVVRDHAARLAYVPNDPLWPDQWHMRTVKADLAWDQSFGSPVTVAVIDTGVLRTHPDLAGQMWENTGEIAGNGVDDDGNGYVDDRYGWDFAYGDNDPEDTWGHGTPCAGIVAAAQDNSIGVTGVAPRAKVMAVKACDHNGYLYASYLVPAYLYATSMGARVFSMSYYSDRVTPAERDALEYAWGQGVLPVAAAGNSASVIPYYPASYRKVLSVAAVDSAEQKSWFSNYGASVGVAAPGQGLTTAGSNGGYVGFGGTSGACPHVAGAAALLFGARPGATNQEVRNAIEDTAKTLFQLPFGEFANYGLLDCQAAMAALLGSPAPPKPLRVRYASLAAGRKRPEPIGPQRTLSGFLAGRGFEAYPSLRLVQSGTQLAVLERGRDRIVYVPQPGLAGPIELRDGATLLATLPVPRQARLSHPMSEASSPGATVVGGYAQTVSPDGDELAVGRNGDGNILLQATFHGVASADPLTVSLLCRTAGSWGHGLNVYVYDWSTASYPYGSWVFLGTVPADGVRRLHRFPLADPPRYADDEGTVYLMVATGAPAPAGAELRVDSFGLDR